MNAVTKFLKTMFPGMGTPNNNRMDQELNQEVKQPQQGDTVLCFPGDEDATQVFPAQVIQSTDGLTVNLQVYTMNHDAPILLRRQVKHKSEAEPGLPYWDWRP